MIKIFTIKYDELTEGFSTEELNTFLINKRINKIREEFFLKDEIPYWTIYIEYEEIIDKKYLKKQREDTKELNQWQKILFEKLREWRKSKAMKEGIPVYLVATNRELKEIVKNGSDSFEKLRLIEGFGKKKIEKYGEEIINIVKNYFKES